MLLCFWPFVLTLGFEQSWVTDWLTTFDLPDLALEFDNRLDWNSWNLELEFVVCWQNKQNSVSNMAWMRKSYYYFLCIFWLYQKRSDENIRSSSKNSFFKKHYWLNSSGWQHNNRFLNCKFYLLADFYQPNFWQFLVLIDLLCYRF